MRIPATATGISNPACMNLLFTHPFGPTSALPHSRNQLIGQSDLIGAWSSSENLYTFRTRVRLVGAFLCSGYH